MDAKKNSLTPPPTGVLERGLLLLSLFGMNRRKLLLKEFAELSGLDKATVLRALKVLTKWGYLIKESDGGYIPGPANLRLATIFKASSNFVSRLEGPISRISKIVEQTTSFFVRSGDERICFARDHAYQDFRYFIEVGGSVPLKEGGAATGLILAFTEPDTPTYQLTRKRGYYISRGERNAHFAAIAVPLFETDESFLGAVVITGMAVDLPDEKLLSFIDVIDQEMRNSGFSISI